MPAALACPACRTGLLARRGDPFCPTCLKASREMTSRPVWPFDSPLLRQALAQVNLSALPAIVRAACGLSQRDIAAMVRWSPAALSYHERGVRDGMFDVRTVLQFADAVGMPRAALQQWQRVRLALKDSAAGETGRQLLAVAGELALCRGWIALDGGRLPLGRPLYDEARELAATAGDAVLSVHVLTNQSMLYAEMARTGPSREPALKQGARQEAVAVATEVLPALEGGVTSMRCLNRLRLVRQAAGNTAGAQEFCERFDGAERLLAASYRPAGGDAQGHRDDVPALCEQATHSLNRQS